MNNIETMATFLGWCTILTVSVQILTAVMVISLGDSLSKFHAKLFNVEETYVRQMYMGYMARLKIMIIVFNLGPYLALKIMGG